MPERLQIAIVAAAVVLASLGPVSRARAEEQGLAPAAPAAATQAPATAATLLEAADAAIDAGHLVLARALYEQLIREYAAAPEADLARRAVKILAARAATETPGVEPASRGVVLRREPYSIKTKERLRLTTWEKLDFGTTAFLYGLSVGYSYALSLDKESDGVPAIAIGALGYTLGAVAFLSLANPDRGDLPLALAITSYLPTTALLVSDAAFDHPSSKKTALATATAGLVSIPLAVYAAHELDLDPGDTQLVRDGGFWGLVLATTGTLGFGGSSQTQFGYESYQAPSSRVVSTAGLVGLYGGLGLGVLAAHFNDISLERVRVSTWGGYGGAILGLLFAAAEKSDSPGVYRGIGIGALAGLVVTFVATSSLDGIPTDDPPTPDAASMHLEPTLSPMVGVDGLTRTMLGLSGRL
jgi:hypothetical protein